MGRFSTLVFRRFIGCDYSRTASRYNRRQN
jgi:hypothetical protein